MLTGVRLFFSKSTFFRPMLLPRQGDNKRNVKFFLLALCKQMTVDIYRMYGLRAGRYKVATGRSDETFNQGFSQQRATYKQIFHPDVTDQTKATIIEVTEGSEANDVDIKLGAALPTFSASGRLVDSEKGLPIPNLPFSFQRLVGQRA